MITNLPKVNVGDRSQFFNSTETVALVRPDIHTSPIATSSHVSPERSVGGPGKARQKELIKEYVENLQLHPLVETRLVKSRGKKHDEAMKSGNPDKIEFSRLKDGAQFGRAMLQDMLEKFLRAGMGETVDSSAVSIESVVRKRIHDTKLQDELIKYINKHIKKDYQEISNLTERVTPASERGAIFDARGTNLRGSLVSTLNKEVYLIQDRFNPSENSEILRTHPGLRSKKINLTVENKIGQGHTGKVQIAKPLGGGDPVAVKIARRHDISLNELKTFMSLKAGEQSSKIRDGASLPECVMQFMEIYKFGDIANMSALIHKKVSAEHIKEKLIASLAYSAIKAIQFLHDQDVSHRDIKPGNLTLSEGGVVKPIDFGFATRKKEYGDLKGQPRRGPGTKGYREDEIRQSETPLTADLYALGKTLCAIANVRSEDATNSSTQDSSHDFKSQSLHTLDRIGKNLTDSHVIVRPSAEEVLNYPYFRNAPPLQDLVPIIETLHQEPDKSNCERFAVAHFQNLNKANWRQLNDLRNIVGSKDQEEFPKALDNLVEFAMHEGIGWHIINQVIEDLKYMINDRQDHKSLVNVQSGLARLLAAGFLDKETALPLLDMLISQAKGDNIETAKGAVSALSELLISRKLNYQGILRLTAKALGEVINGSTPALADHVKSLCHPQNLSKIQIEDWVSPRLES